MSRTQCDLEKEVSDAVTVWAPRFQDQTSWFNRLIVSCDKSFPLWTACRFNHHYPYIHPLPASSARTHAATASIFFVYPIVQFSFLRQQQWGQMWCFKKTSSALKAMEQYGKRIHLSCLENCSWTSCCLRDLVADATTPTATTLNPITPLTFAQNSEAQESHNRTGCLNGAKDIISTTATAIKLMPTCCPKHVSSGLSAMIKLHLY